MHRIRVRFSSLCSGVKLRVPKSRSYTKDLGLAYQRVYCGTYKELINRRRCFKKGTWLVRRFHVCLNAAPGLWRLVTVRLRIAMQMLSGIAAIMMNSLFCIAVCATVGAYLRTDAGAGKATSKHYMSTHLW